MRVFVTVGSTQFDDLVKSSLSLPVLDALLAKGYTALVVQCGKFAHPLSEFTQEEDGLWRRTMAGVEVEIWRYKPSLADEFAAADLVISHAGAYSNFSPNLLL